MLGAVVFAATAFSSNAAFNARLQGQSRGSTVWLDGNLQGWRDLDVIPCRVYLTGGPANNKVITVEFDHTQGRNPAIQEIYGFSPSANVVITSAPVLSAPANSARWSYRFMIKLLDSKPGSVTFTARLANGAHLNGGSSVGMRGSPSLGSLQVHKIAPAPAPCVIDLALVKSGSAEAAPGQTITYSLQYSNKASSTTAAKNVQISDLIPPQVTVVAETLGSGRLVGNTVLWDLGMVGASTGGTLTYSVRVNANVAFGEVFTNSASISSAHSDADRNDNNSTVTTRVVFNRPPVANSDAYEGRQNQAMTVTAPGVLANDTDVEGNPLTAILVSGPAQGTIVLNADGSFVYTPTANYHGSDSFIYKANDGTADSPSVSVFILLQPTKQNTAPVAANDQYTVATDTLLNVPGPGVLGNDTDANGDSLTATAVSGPAHGTLILNANGSFTYSPTVGFAGEDKFTYKANDGLADSLSAMVTITVQGSSNTNTPPPPPPPPPPTNAPPVVSLTSPTNGAIYIEGMDVPLIAEASDPDGTVSRVDFLSDDANVGTDSQGPYSIVLTNIAAGEYTFRAVATDDGSASTVSVPVAILVLEHPPLVAGPFTLNRQTGLFEQVVTVTNPTPFIFQGIRLWIMNVRPAATVWNATGRVEGQPFIDAAIAIPPGGSVAIRIEYYTPDLRVPPAPTFFPEVL